MSCIWTINSYSLSQDHHETLYPTINLSTYILLVSVYTLTSICMHVRCIHASCMQMYRENMFVTNSSNTNFSIQKCPPNRDSIKQFRSRWMFRLEQLCNPTQFSHTATRPMYLLIIPINGIQRVQARNQACLPFIICQFLHFVTAFKITDVEYAMLNDTIAITSR